ncbi:hypothetical protein [Brevundimonas sp.]|jgi:hypothetical protein|uniref:hypothetical protein n=1 Tax=Brevundimonas sp. TaxID=1871086 RepID=UPI003783F318
MIEWPTRGRRLLAEGASCVLALCIGAVLLFGPASGAIAAAGPDVRSFYLISLAQTPLPEAADAVLVKSLGSTMRIDEGVDADITLSIAEPMTVEDLEIAFAAELSNHGIALIREGEGYRLADVSVAMVETPQPIIVGAPLPTPKVTIAQQSASADGPAVISEPKGKAWWLYAALILVASVVAGLAIRFGRPLIMGLRRRFAHTSRRPAAATNSTQRGAVVDWLLSQHSVPLPLLASACDRAARLARPVEQALCDVGAVTEANLADAYCAITGLSRWDPATAPTLASGDVVLDGFIKNHPLRIVEMDDWSLVAACADPLDDRTYAALSRTARRMVTLRVGLLSEISPEGGAATDPEHHAPLVIVPWSRPRPDGARLLQAVLARRTAAEAVQIPAGLNGQ